MQFMIRTPFDALINEVIGKIFTSTGQTYTPKEIAIVKIPTTENFFAALEFYTVETDDDIRVQAYLQEGTDDASSKMWLKNQADFYCSKYSILYPQYGEKTNVYTYVRTIRSSLIMDDILELPTACNNGYEFLVTESGVSILTNDLVNISVTTIQQPLLLEDSGYLLTETNEPILLGA